MSFIQEELRNYSAKGWQGILGTGNRSTAPDNLTYYEESFSNSLSIDARSVLTQLEDVPPASNQTEADTNVAANITIMRGFGTPADPTTALHLTPTPNNKAFMCTSTYGDMNTRLKNFIQPQMIQNGDYASIGYTARLYQGDPNAGGTEINTTIDQVGADVGWFFMYGAGAVIVSSSFTGILDPNDVWLVCYQYIGPTSAAEVKVDDITIEKSALPPYEESGGATVSELIQNNWFSGVDDSWVTGTHGTTNYTEPVLFISAGEYVILHSDTAYSPWEAGTYRFYADNDLTVDGVVAFWDDAAGNGVYFTSTLDPDNGLYLHEATLDGTENIYEVSFDNALLSDTNVYLVNRYTYTGIIADPSITIKGINHIIDDDYKSIDGSDTPMREAHKELVTRAFFNANAMIIPVTYAELKALYDAGNMTGGAFYKISDYVHKNWLDPEHTGIYTAPNSPIVVYADKNDSLSWFGIDDTYSDELIIYDINNSVDITANQNRNGNGHISSVDGYILDGLPGINNNVTDSNHWDIGTAIIITGNVQVKVNGSIPPQHTTWDQSTGILTTDANIQNGFMWNVELIADKAIYNDPTKTTGSIKYRKDFKRNIKGNIDWRNTHYNRWSIDLHLPSYIDSPTLPSSQSVNTGIFHDNSVITLTPTGSPVVLPMLPENKNHRNLSFRNCKYTVLDYDSFIKDLEMIDVNKFTSKSIGNSKIKYVEDFYVMHGFSDTIISGTSGQSRRVYSPALINSSIFSSLENQYFPIRVTGWKINSKMSLVGFNTYISENVIIDSYQSFNNCTFSGHFDNINLKAYRVGNIHITGNFQRNNIMAAGLFQQFTCSGDFSDNTLSVPQFSSITFGNFINNNITSEIYYADFGDIENTEINGPIIGSTTEHVTETDSIINNAISVNANKTATILPITYALDSTGGSFDIELPKNPTENLTLTFLDIEGHCTIDNVNIVVSATPNVGVVNTINGNTSYTIGTNYSFFEIRYNSTGGWVIMTESQSTISPDDITIEKNGSNLFTVKGIDYIIDDDGESIDGSDTPMSDPHKELITRAKAEEIVSTNTNWLKKWDDVDGDGTSDERTLYPADSLVKKMEIKENTRGMNQIYIENSENDSGNDNYTGATVVLTASSAAYTNQTYIAHHGLDYYDTLLAGRGAIQTDSSMIIGAYNSTDQQGQPAFVSFVCGDDYYHQKEIYRLTTNGLEMTLPDKKIFYEAGKTPIADPAIYTDLRCNTVTGEIYAAAGSADLTETTERFTITAADVANGYITIANVPNTAKHIFVIQNGLVQDIDPGADVTLSGNRVNFIGNPLEVGDKVLVKYSY